MSIRPSHQVSTGRPRYACTLRSIRPWPSRAGKDVFGEYQTMRPYRSRIIRPGSPGPVRG
ncbi:MAG TPA: hypothetical protein VKV35_02960 [Streptosporangiaceae bacterium]|nr:hypothetical protein [Streptosporangiaceae bacterium]